MINVSREEVLYIAHLSRIDIQENEIEPLRKSLEEILSYAARVQEVAAAAEYVPHKNINVMRDDQPVPTDPQPLLAQAPVREESYVVVPAVLDNEREGAL